MLNGQPWPKISVVTPSYQQGVFLEETLRSVLLQNYPNLEYIVIDGGSTDESRAVLERYAPFLTYWESERDSGQANAINKGFRRATGAIMGWLNSDDLLRPDALFEIALAFARDPNCMAVTGFREVIGTESEFLHYWLCDLPTKYYLRHYCAIVQETTYWRREVWDQLGELDETFHYALDYEYWLRMLDAGYVFKLIPKRLGMFRNYPANKTNSLMNSTQVHDMLRLYKKYRMGMSEETVLLDLGRAWGVKYRFLGELGYQPVARHTQAMVWLLRLFELKPLLYGFCYAYLQYRRYRPFGVAEQPYSVQAALLRAIWHGLRGLPRNVMRALHKREALHHSIRQVPRLPFSDHDNVLEQLQREFGDLAPDGLFIGRGWHALEHAQGEYFRWVDNDAEFLLTALSGDKRDLLIEAETGPDLGLAPFILFLLDEQGTVLDQKLINGREKVALQLREVEPGMPLKMVRLHIEPGQVARVKAIGEQRILNFRVFQCALDIFPNTASQVSTPPPVSSAIDAIPEVIIDDAGAIAARNDIEAPAYPIQLGRNWHGVERYRGQVFRWVTNDAEVILQTSAGGQRTLWLDVARGPSLTAKHYRVQLVNQAGEVVSSAIIKRWGRIMFELAVEANAPTVFRLHVENEGRRASVMDERVLNFRVFQMGWQGR